MAKWWKCHIHRGDSHIRTHSAIGQDINTLHHRCGIGHRNLGISPTTALAIHASEDIGYRLLDLGRSLNYGIGHSGHKALFLSAIIRCSTVTLFSFDDHTSLKVTILLEVVHRHKLLLAKAKTVRERVDSLSRRHTMLILAKSLSSARLTLSTLTLNIVRSDITSVGTTHHYNIARANMVDIEFRIILLEHSHRYLIPARYGVDRLAALDLMANEYILSAIGRSVGVHPTLATLILLQAWDENVFIGLKRLGRKSHIAT